MVLTNRLEKLIVALNFEINMICVGYTEPFMATLVFLDFIDS